MRFAIIASARTGSSHLTNLLNSRSDILCNGEICHPKKVYVNWHKRYRTPERLGELAALRSAAPAKFLEQIFEIDHDRPHVGFKILRGQYQDVLRAVLEDRTIRKVILFRRNVLANFSSKLIANETGQYGLNAQKAPRESREPIKVLFDAERFKVHRRKYERYYASAMNTLLQGGQNFHLINYEEINNPWFFRSLLAYIGAESLAPPDEGKLIKQNPSNILSRFSNSREVEEFLLANDLVHWSFEGQVTFDVENVGRWRPGKAGGKKKKSALLPASVA
ncbi:MAG TPA: hypothetical protein VKR31_01190 [Rhizomicrobium sp.]|nr:hypothetical protein [Rhizomicrobium sp.]